MIALSKIKKLFVVEKSKRESSRVSVQLSLEKYGTKLRDDSEDDACSHNKRGNFKVKEKTFSRD